MHKYHKGSKSKGAIVDIKSTFLLQCQAREKIER